MKNFTLLLLLGCMLHFSGFGQEKNGIVPVAAKDFTVKLIKFYPNPATTVINFEFQQGYDKSYNFQIYNFLGKKVLEINNVSVNNQVNLSDFNRGVYIFQLRDKSGKILESGKFQVSK
ncbi:MAG: T9SS type A sorting domain-containing protein [Chitinophagaceae bacterium]|nr:T9SS type A sorting domain-containing protein [Chitinophagaceae bacterium]